jgi:DNA-binding NarL/FixJ family response regulator
MHIGPPLHVLLVDDHDLFRETLSLALGSMDQFEVVSSNTSLQATEILQSRRVEVLVTDFNLGFETAFDFLSALSRSGIQVSNVAILTAGVSLNQARSLIHEFNVDGIVVKDVTLLRLVECINAIASGEKIYDSRYSDAVSKSTVSALTPREREVMKRVVDGLSNKQIAAELFASESTVKNVLQALFEKHAVRTRSQLVRVAIDEEYARLQVSSDRGNGQSSGNYSEISVFPPGLCSKAVC